MSRGGVTDSGLMAKLRAGAKISGQPPPPSRSFKRGSLGVRLSKYSAHAVDNLSRLGCVNRVGVVQQQQPIENWSAGASAWAAIEVHVQNTREVKEGCAFKIVP